MATVTKNSLFAGILSILLCTILIIASCERKQEGGVFIPLPKDSSALGRINHFIPVKDIEAFKAAFAAQRDTLARLAPYLSIPVSETFNKQALLNLLQDSTNVGIRIYYGLKPGGNRNEFRLVIVGVNAQGQDIYYSNGLEGGKLNAKLPPPPLMGGVEYGQCTPPCFQQGSGD